MGDFIRLSSLEMEIMTLVIANGKTYGLKVMDLLNKGRKENYLPEIPYGSFYPALKKLQREGLLKISQPELDKRKKHYEVTGLGESTYRVNANYESWVNSRPTLSFDSG
ncbi:MAG: PadR family transcriptional regulator [Microcystaceae cyanobacterium]